MMSRCILNLHEYDAQLLEAAEEFEMSLLSCPAPIAGISDYFEDEPQAEPSGGMC